MANTKRIHYPSFSVRLTPEVKNIVDTLTKELKCNQTSLVLFALQVFKQNLNDDVKEKIAKKIEIQSKKKREEALKQRDIQNQIKQKQGIIKLGRPPQKRNKQKAS